MGAKGNWFWGGIEQVLGDGMNADFWDGLWSGEKPLNEVFPRLYNLSTKKGGKLRRWEVG